MKKNKENKIEIFSLYFISESEFKLFIFISSIFRSFIFQLLSDKNQSRIYSKKRQLHTSSAVQTFNSFLIRNGRNLRTLRSVLTLFKLWSVAVLYSYIISVV